MPVAYSYMEERLPHYMFIAAGSDGYFTTMMLLRTTIYFDGHELIPFPGSSMERNLLSVDVSCRLRISMLVSSTPKFLQHWPNLFFLPLVSFKTMNQAKNSSFGLAFA